jgi:hypothetical protein
VRIIHNAWTYQRGRCGCEVCTADNTLQQRKGRESRARRLAQDPTLATHGLYTTYNNWVCRCEPCREAARAWRRQHRPRAIPPFGREWVRQP